MTADHDGLRRDRLIQLSAEVGRIATTLEHLSTDHDRVIVPAFAGPAAPEVSVETVRSVIRARRLRRKYLEEALFSDPAWDMMLDLLESELSGRKITVSSLCVAAAVPATTALRWIKMLVKKGLFVRHNDQFDGRRVYVELSPDASTSLKRYFAATAQLTII